MLVKIAFAARNGERCYCTSMDTPFSTLADLPHIDSSQLAGRNVYLMPVWNGSSWETWFPTEQDKLIKLSIVNILRSNYLAKECAHHDDIHIDFLEFMWQHMSWPSVAKVTSNLAQDIHLMATSAAKLEHFHHAREAIGQDLLPTFVNSEVEHLLVIARSMFDLLQEAIAHFWNDCVKLNDPELQKLKKQRPLQPTFSKIVLDGEKLRTAEQIAERYSLPVKMAETYAKHAPFFKSVRGARDQIVHAGKTPDSVFATERGFCVNPKAPYFSDFPWSEEHYYNENLVTLVPWVARLVGGTLEACSEIILSMTAHLQFPPALFPNYRLFLRDPSNPALMRLAEAAQGPNHWWHEAPVVIGDADAVENAEPAP